MTNKFMGLCKRHEIHGAIDGFIFPNTIENPFDFPTIREMAVASIGDCDNLTLYVTGLTPVLVEVINLCRDKGINLVLMHFNSATGDYVPQPIH